MDKPQRYHIGKWSSDTTIQPQGEPIESADGWWYAVDEADKVFAALLSEIEELKRERNRYREMANKVQLGEGSYQFQFLSEAEARAEAAESREKDLAATVRHSRGVIKELRDFAEHEIKEIGGCDHSVGICCCGIYSLIATADEILSLPIPGSAERMREEVRRGDVASFVRKYAGKWRDKDDGYWLARLMQEVGELASSLVGDHDDPPEHELCQIASIAENWLNKRAASEKGGEG